ncbi:pilus assembly PilX family protein [Niveibacterium terrae]|uniref:pilus assembly PilX family protein n=1 Tax=Niveibacterium terrae TaxID=3373598 RepID=UPI003A919197
MSRSDNKFPFRESQKQAGFSLVVVLVFMMVIMMLGITAMQAAGLQERMASHSRDRAIALQATETTLREGEAATREISAFDGDSSCTNAFCSTGNAPDLYSYTWDDAKSATASSSELSATLATSPRYFIEYTGLIPNPGSGGPAKTFRVTAHSTGQNSSTIVTLQSAFYPVK